MTQIRKRYFCFTSGFELCLDEVEFVLDPGEFITALETRSNQITGCQLILRIQTSNNKTFISHADDIDGRILRFHWEIDQCLSNPEIAEKGQNSEPVDDSDEPNEEIVESSGTTNISARMISTGHDEMQHLCCSLNMQKGARRIITGQIKIQGGMKNVLKEIICCPVGIFLKSLTFVKLLS